jgi:hypothetical protein
MTAMYIQELNKGTLFVVTDGYHMIGGYYKTRKGAEKLLTKLTK